MTRIALVCLLVVGVGLGAFLFGRSSATKSGTYHEGFLAGHEDAFGPYDGGWGYGELYIVTLRRGGPGETYQFADRWPMMPGIEYKACGKKLCSRPAR